MLSLHNVYSGYGIVNILTNISLEVNSKEIVSIIGANGAGKSTLLKTISSLLACREGRIIFEGKDITKFSPDKVVELGIIQVPEGRQVIGEITVYENLILGCYLKYGKLGKSGRKKLIDYVCLLFPILRDRMNQIAGTLSGGEQQMLAVGRALMGEPKLLLTDEPSLGLAPKVVDMVCSVLMELNKNGLTLIMVEQNALIALEMAERAYVLEEGKITLQGKGKDLLQDDNVRKSYLGV